MATSQQAQRVGLVEIVRQALRRISGAAELDAENALLAAKCARLQVEVDELRPRCHDLGNRCMISEGQAIVLRDALGIALLGGKPGELAWAREIYRRTAAGDEIGVLVSQIQRVAAELRRRKAAATGDGR